MLPNGRRPRVLMALHPRADDRMCRILEGLEPSRVGELGELVHALGCGSFDLVIVGSHFDGSRGIEALRCARLLAPHAALACVRVVPFSTPLGDATLTAFQAAAEGLGADGFIDLLKFADDEEGNARVRAMLDRLMDVTRA
jgi:hypothetical protein